MSNLLIVFLIIFTPIAYGTVEVWSMTVLHAVSIVIIALWTYTMIHNGRLKLYRTPVDIPVLLFLCLVCISLFISVYPSASLVLFYKILNYVLIFYILINTIREPENLMPLLWVIILFGSVYALAGLTVVGGKFLGFKTFSPDHYNVSLNFVNHNHFAGYLEMVVLLCIGMAMAKKGTVRALLMFMGVYVAVAVVFSLSRGGAMGLLGGLFFLLGVLAFFKGMQKKFWLLACFLIIVLMVMTWLGLKPVIKRLEKLKDPMLIGKRRVEIWQGTLKMISANPWFGTGIGTFIYAYPRYQTEDMAGWVVNHAHNDFLELAAEMGIIGFLSAIFCIAALFIAGLKGLAAQPDKEMKIIGLGALAGCFSLLVHACVDFNLHIPSNALLFSVCAAIVVIASNLGKNRKMPALVDIKLSKRCRGFAGITTAILLICSLALVVSGFLGMNCLKEARAYQKAGDYEQAFETLQKAIFFNPGNAEHLAAMGDLLMMRSSQSKAPSEKERDLLESLRYYNEAIRACPVRGYYYTKKAFSLDRLEMYKEAERVFKEAVYFSPTSAFTHYNLGAFYLKQERLDQAYEEYRRLLELDNKYLDTVLDELWEVKTGYQNLKRAVPEKSDIRKRVGRYLLKKGEETAALNEFALAFSLEPTVQNAIAHIRAICSLKEYRLALVEAKKYLSQFRDDVCLQKQIATIYKNLGEHEGTFAIYRDLFSKNPADISICVTLSDLYRKHNSVDKAVEILKKGLEHKPYNARLYYKLALCFRAMRRSEDALNAFKEAVFLMPEETKYRYQLGKEYTDNGLYQEAVEQWKLCLKTNPKHTGCKRSIKEVYRILGVDEKKLSLFNSRKSSHAEKEKNNE